MRRVGAGIPTPGQTKWLAGRVSAKVWMTGGSVTSSSVTDNSVTESYAFLLEHLMHSRRWLNEVLGVAPEDADAFVRFTLFQKLWFLRRYVAKLNYELELHTGPVDDQGGTYIRWLERGGRVTVPPERYLSDVDDAFYVAQYIRAWILEMQWRRHLERTFGEDWYNRRDAGEFLIGLWRIGQRDNADEMAAHLGASGLDVTPLIKEALAAEL